MMNENRILKWPQIYDSPYFRSFPNGMNGVGQTTVPLQLREVFADKRISSNAGNFYGTLANSSTLPFEMHYLSRYEALELESSENTQIKSQNDRPSPEISRESRANSQVPARVCDVEGGAVCSKNSTFGDFDETAWTPRLRSPGYTLEVMR